MGFPPVPPPAPLPCALREAPGLGSALVFSDSVVFTPNTSDRRGPITGAADSSADKCARGRNVNAAPPGKALEQGGLQSLTGFEPSPQTAWGWRRRMERGRGAASSRVGVRAAWCRRLHVWGARLEMRPGCIAHGWRQTGQICRKIGKSFPFPAALPYQGAVLINHRSFLQCPPPLTSIAD